jgi:magnesium transporter
MVSIFHYTRDRIETLTLKDLHQHLQSPDGTIWVDMEDPSEAEEETILLSLFNIHPLAVEDCRRGRTDEGHLPKVEDFGDYLFVIFNPLRYAEETKGARRHQPLNIETTQLSTFISKEYLITHHMRHLASLEQTQNLCLKNPRAGEKGPDYLFHLVIDNIVDAYSPVLDRLDVAVDELEDEVFRSPSQQTMARILQIKKDIMTIRRIAVYQREMLSRLSRGEFALITAEEMVFYRNVYDHLVRMSDVADSYRDIVSGLLDAYLSVTSNRLNQIMKVLTIISTIFLPLSFITGFFGMNFKFIPLLEWEYGVGVAAGIMVAVGAGMLWLFRRNKWL